MRTEWELGKPPCLVTVKAIVRGHVRKGVSDGVYFWFSDCDRPEQNMVNVIEVVEAWKVDDEN